MYYIKSWMPFGSRQPQPAPTPERTEIPGNVLPSDVDQLAELFKQELFKQLNQSTGVIRTFLDSPEVNGNGVNVPPSRLGSLFSYGRQPQPATTPERAEIPGIPADIDQLAEVFRQEIIKQLNQSTVNGNGVNVTSPGPQPLGDPLFSNEVTAPGVDNNHLAAVKEAYKSLNYILDWLGRPTSQQARSRLQNDARESLNVLGRHIFGVDGAKNIFYHEGYNEPENEQSERAELQGMSLP